jgi:hypothetical protein
MKVKKRKTPLALIQRALEARYVREALQPRRVLFRVVRKRRKTSADCVVVAGARVVRPRIVRMAAGCVAFTLLTQKRASFACPFLLTNPAKSGFSLFDV